jgi:putative tricarboxylic transport membrane protein
MDHMTGSERFTFGIVKLYDGFSFVPALIGLFALSEVFANIEKYDFYMTKIDVAELKSIWPTLRDYWKLKWAMLRAGVLGTVIGIFPGAGGTIASFIAYDVEKRLNKHPEEFGKGSPYGVTAAEASNSSSVGGALVPLLALGIPGSASAAVLIGALMIHELRPGPELFTRNAELVYTLFSSMFVANIVLLILGAFGSRVWVKVSLVPKTILYPLIFAFSMIGSYAVRSSAFDIGVCLGFGVLGWILNRYRYPVSPIVLGLVLGTMIETNFRMTLMMGGASLFVSRPISLVLMLISVVLISWPFISDARSRRNKSGSAAS